MLSQFRRLRRVGSLSNASARAAVPDRPGGLMPLFDLQMRLRSADVWPQRTRTAVHRQHRSEAGRAHLPSPPCGPELRRNAPQSTQAARTRQSISATLEGLSNTEINVERAGLLRASEIGNNTVTAGWIFL